MSNLWIINDRFSVNKNTARKGGTATVYRGMDLETETLVAIKLFNNSDIKQELTTEAFQRDVKSLYELSSHVNIAKIIEADRDKESNNYFIAMEWLEESLLDVVNKHEITCWDDFYTHYGKPILEALSFSHKRDIVHRDIKPANVLFSEDGTLRIVDFGISKYKTYYGSNVTFCGWNSKPYAPPENDNFQYINTRDIYSFAVLSLACLERRDLEEEENVLETLKNHALEDGVSDVLESCLSYSPEDRIQSIEELIDSLDRFSASNNTTNLENIGNCYLALTNAAIQKLQLSTGLSDKTSIERHVSRELNEACAIERQENGKYNFISVEHSFIVAVDEKTKSHFVIIAALRKESWMLENLRSKNFSPKIHYTVGNTPSSTHVKSSTIKVLDEYSEYEANRSERLKDLERKNLIGSWKSQLRLQFDLEKIAKNEVEYRKFRVKDEQIIFHVKPGDWSDLEGQVRLVKCENKKSISVIVDKTSKDRIYASSEILDEDNIPIKGTLSLDTRMQAISRIRQEEAFDDVLFGRSHRADLAKLIFNPKNSRPHISKEVKEYFQGDLDKAKRKVVSAVLGMKDFLVVNGPPGTGKTKVIAEIVLQYLLANPDAKILISSQTHNALDNALERIREVKGDDSSLGAVRIGRREDRRISESVKDLLLDSLVSIWLKKIREKSTRYLDEWSEKLGVDRSEVELGLSVRVLRRSLNKFDELVERRENLQSDIRNLERIISEMKSKEKITDELSLNIFNREKIVENLRDVDDELVRARRRYRDAQKSLTEGFPDGDSLAALGPSELLEWEEEYLTGSKERENCRSVIELLQDWFDRFGRSEDFNAAFLNDSSIVAATCIGIGLKAYRDVKFDLCIVDEASKATPTEALLPVVKSKKWVFVGDQAQLPPFIQEGASNQALLNKHGLQLGDLKKTLLDRLMSTLPSDSIISLDTQYRMCPEIGKLVSHIFYDRQLETGRGPSIPFNKYYAIKKPVTWYCTSNESKRYESKDGNSYINRLEANYISTLLKRFNLAAQTLSKNFSVCVLSFYSSQQNVLKTEIARVDSDCDHLDICCDTVDAFQGREADISIISVTRSNNNGSLGFVDDRNRINVAISRGKEALIIVGDSKFCAQSGQGNPLELVLSYIHDNKSDCALAEI